MGGLNRIRNNIERYDMSQPVVMSQQAYENEKRKIHDMYANEYNEKLHALRDKCNEEISQRISHAINLILVHTAYELGTQLEMFQDEVEHEEEKIELVQNIMTNVHNSIEKASHRKSPTKEFNKMKTKIKNKMRIEF